MSNEATIDQISNNIKEWCYAKRNESARIDPDLKEPQQQLTNCMFDAIFMVMADMEIRLRKLEQNKQQ